MSGEKTEKPTAKRQKEARKDGQVPRTQELGAWCAILLVGLALPGLVGRELESLRSLMLRCLDATADPSVDVASRLLLDGVAHATIVVVLLAVAVMLISVAGTVAQGGFYLATKSVKPKLSKLDPIQGMKRIFGPQALWEGAKMLVKCALVTGFVYSAVKAMVPLIGGLVPMAAVLSAVSDHALGMLRSVAVAGILMAGVDYAYNRRRVGKQTRMSKDDIKQEHKQTEGDPLVKSHIRGRQLAAARNRMMADVPQADVVLVNPTHVAVALRYEASKGAPVVVALGAGTVAAKIRELAEEHRVPMVRDVPLARALYSATEVGHSIPPELFAAVAQVLAFVISRKAAGQAAGQHRSPRTEADLPAVPAAGKRRRAAARPAPAIASGAVPAGR